MEIIIRKERLSTFLGCTLRCYGTYAHLCMVAVLVTVVMSAEGGVIGNRTVHQWLSAANRVSVGEVLSIDNVGARSVWRIRIMRDYFGSGEEVVDVSWIRDLSRDERKEIIGSLGLFAVDHERNFVGRTGASLVRDVFAQTPQRISRATAPAVRVCVDWLRALAIESNIVLRDLAVFGAYCASDREVGIASLGELQDDVMGVTAATVLKVALQQTLGVTELFDVANELDEESSAKLIENVGWVLLSFRESSPIALEGLARLASESKQYYLRHCAATALVVIHTEDSWPHLSDLLFSEDKSIRLLAISGLQQIVDAGLDPDSPRFEEPILLEGKPILRQRRARPRIDESYRLRESNRPVDSDTALVGYWRSYASANQ